jgi:hypothetical protein
MSSASSSVISMFSIWQKLLCVCSFDKFCKVNCIHESIQIKTSYVALNFLCFYFDLIWTYSYYPKYVKGNSFEHGNITRWSSLLGELLFRSNARVRISHYICYCHSLNSVIARRIWSKLVLSKSYWSKPDGNDHFGFCQFCILDKTSFDQICRAMTEVGIWQ